MSQGIKHGAGPHFCIVWHVVLCTWLAIANANGVPKKNTTVTYCGRAVSIGVGLVPSQSLVRTGADSIHCLENPNQFTAEDGLSFTECLDNSVDLMEAEQLPFFGVDIGNTTIVLTAFIEPGHVRGVCLVSNLTAPSYLPGQKEQGNVPEIVCFHPLEPTAKFLAQTCSAVGCVNHFFLAAMGSCGKPEDVGPTALSWAAAGFPSNNISELSESFASAPFSRQGTRKQPKQSTVIYCARTLSILSGENPLPHEELTTASDPIYCTSIPGQSRTSLGAVFTECRSFGVVLESAQSTTIFEIVLGTTNILVSAELAQRGNEDLVCMHIANTNTSETLLLRDKPCFGRDMPGRLYISTTCVPQGCSDHYFLASRGACEMKASRGRRMLIM